MRSQDIYWEHVFVYSTDTLLLLGMLAMIAISNPENSYLKAAPIINIEILESDVAIFEVNYVFEGSKSWVYPPKWSLNHLLPMNDIRTFGYPYGIHIVDENKSVIQRGFKGHVVSSHLPFKRLNTTEKTFTVYELSFPAPKGLSGGPLLDIRKQVNYGLIIGNSESSMLVYEHEERESSGENTTTVEHWSKLSLGIAVTADVILNQESELLQSNICGFLDKNNGIA